MRLQAEFSMSDRFSMIAKPSSKGMREREQLIQGSFDQMVEVEMKDDGKSFVFRPIERKPAKVPTKGVSIALNLSDADPF